MKMLALAVAALALGACSYVTSGANADPRVSGELWYVRTQSFLGLPVGTSIWYCAPTTGEVAHCEQAVMADSGGHDEPPPTPSKSPEAAAAADDPQPSVLWSVASSEEGGPKACGQVLSLLREDEACAGESCRAPLALLSVYVKRCGQDPEAQESAKALREKWRPQATGEPPDCFRALLRLARSNATDVAQRYAVACRGSRTFSRMEKAVLTSAGVEGKDSGGPAQSK